MTGRQLVPLLVQFKDRRAEHGGDSEIESEVSGRRALYAEQFSPQNRSAGARGPWNESRALAQANLKSFAERKIVASFPTGTGRNALKDQNDDSANQPGRSDH